MKYENKLNYFSSIRLVTEEDREYLKEVSSSKFKYQLQDLIHKNSFYSVNEFKEYYQN